MDLSYRWAEHVAVISPGMIDLLASRGVPRDKLSLIYNAVDHSAGDRKTELSRHGLGIPDEALLLMYAGNHGPAQALETVVRAVANVESERECHLLMVGTGVEKERLSALAQDLAPRRIHFVAPQPRETIPSLMRIADVQVVSLADRPLFAVTMPSKVQGVLASGEPMLAIAHGDVRNVVLAAGCGEVAAPGEVAAVETAVRSLMARGVEELRDLGARGADYYWRHMAHEIGARRLTGVLRRAAAEAQSSGARCPSALWRHSTSNQVTRENRNVGQE